MLTNTLAKASEYIFAYSFISIHKNFFFKYRNIYVYFEKKMGGRSPPPPLLADASANYADFFTFSLLSSLGPHFKCEQILSSLNDR